ncbi:MAG TPA: cation transporter [Rubrobacter sp.]
MGNELRKVALPVTGMRCAASVNLAVEKATVEYDPASTNPEALIRAVEDAGYGVIREKEGPAEDVREYGRLRRRFLVAAALTVLVLIGSLPMMLGFMVPVRWLNLVSLALATPVQFWAGWRFYEGAWGALRHGQTNMNTLVAVGTSAAYLYSAVATLAPGLFEGRADVSFDTSSLIVTLILLGRLLEARARGRMDEAIKKLAGLQAKTAVEHCVRESIEKGEGADEKIEELTAAVERFLRV